jgi:hypothetical protein
MQGLLSNPNADPDRVDFSKDLAEAAFYTADAMLAHLGGSNEAE